MTKTPDFTETRKTVRTATEATRAPPGTVVARIAETQVVPEELQDALAEDAQAHIAAGKRMGEVAARLGSLVMRLRQNARVTEPVCSQAAELMHIECNKLHCIIKFAETGE